LRVTQYHAERGDRSGEPCVLGGASHGRSQGDFEESAGVGGRRLVAQLDVAELGAAARTYRLRSRLVAEPGRFAHLDGALDACGHQLVQSGDSVAGTELARILPV